MGTQFVWTDKEVIDFANNLYIDKKAEQWIEQFKKSKQSAVDTVDKEWHKCKYCGASVYGGDDEQCFSNPKNNPAEHKLNPVKPPLGIMPEYIWKEKRIGDLRDAMKRYIDEQRSVPLEWIKEYYDLTEWTKQSNTN